MIVLSFGEVATVVDRCYRSKFNIATLSRVPSVESQTIIDFAHPNLAYNIYGDSSARFLYRMFYNSSPKSYPIHPNQHLISTTVYATKFRDSGE